MPDVEDVRSSDIRTRRTRAAKRNNKARAIRSGREKLIRACRARLLSSLSFCFFVRDALPARIDEQRRARTRGKKKGYKLNRARRTRDVSRARRGFGVFAVLEFKGFYRGNNRWLFLPRKCHVNTRTIQYAPEHLNDA